MSMWASATSEVMSTRVSATSEVMSIMSTRASATSEVMSMHPGHVEQKSVARFMCIKGMCYTYFTGEITVNIAGKERRCYEFD
jgi:hypothetical protein